MSDARSLLRAQKAQAGPSQQLVDPYATTTAKGELRCSVCVTPVKHWAAHTASKQHKTSLQRVRAEEAKAAAKAQKRRKVEVGPADVADAGGEGPALPPGMQRGDENAEGPARKKARIAEPSGGSGAPPVPPAPVDDELDSFLSSIASLPAEPAETPQASGAATKSRKSYKPSEPETQTSYEAAPSLILPAASGDDDPSSISAGATAAMNPFASRLASGAAGPAAPAGPEAEEEEEEEETDAQKRERLQREEREEIMDRLAEETRAQEDGDDRVRALKARVEAMRQARKARQAKK